MEQLTPAGCGPFRFRERQQSTQPVLHLGLGTAAIAKQRDLAAEGPVYRRIVVSW